MLLLPQALGSTPHPVPATFAVRDYELIGNTLLEQSAVDAALTNAVGPAVTLDQVFKALAALYRAYSERGFPTVSVSIPQQSLGRGTVTVRIVEGDWVIAHARGSAPPKVSKPATFRVDTYDIVGNTLLRQETIESIFKEAIGNAVTLAQIQAAAGKLQLAYRERGYLTVAVRVPPQQVTNSTIRVQVIEGKLADIRVVGNRYFSSNNVMRALPGLQTNTLLNSHLFQRELDLANQNRDRQIYPSIGPGPEPATSALILRVKDRLPLHARLEVNNDATPGTPEWRINTSAQYNNLWQEEHQIGISYGFTPEEFKSEGLVPDYIFNRPLISYYGAYYRLPFGSSEATGEQINDSRGFGYDEATHQFRLPPTGGRPDVTLVASASSSDTGVKLGPATTVSQTPLLTIVSQDSGQNLSISEDAGGRVSIPWAMSEGIRFTFSGGVDFKRSLLESFNTNNFFITTVVTNGQGSQTITSQVSSPQPTRHAEADYLPISLGMDLSESDRFGTFSGNLGLSYNFLGNSADFAPLATSANAKSSFGKAIFSIIRDQKVAGGWSFLMRASGQAATGPLINNEQFALGGLNSVRGYYEGDEYGDLGWSATVEARTPFLSTHIPTGKSSSPVFLRGSAFLDLGQRFLIDPRTTENSDSFLWGTGFGLFASVNNYLDMRVVLAWPLADSINTSAGRPRAYFSLGGQF
jgi:hemolysin activation/secretion protein